MKLKNIFKRMIRIGHYNEILDNIINKKISDEIFTWKALKKKKK